MRHTTLDKVPLSSRHALVQQALSEWESGRDVLLAGPIGIGRTTMLDDIATGLADAPTLLLRSSPAAADSGMPLLTVIDLCSGIPPKEFLGLPAHTRHLLQIALHPQDHAGPEPDLRAICLALLDLMRLVTVRRTVTVLIDDLQWTDRASAEALRFVRSRLQPGLFRVIAASRDGEMPIWSDPGDYRLLTLPELSANELALLAPDVSLLLAHRVYAVSGGNPGDALAVLALIRASADAPGPGMPMPVPESWRQQARNRLRLLPASAVDTVRLAAIARRPSLALLVDFHNPACQWAELLDDLAAAADAGICDLTADGTVEFGHPMLREAIRGLTPAAWRMGRHARLAEVSTDPAEQAWHFALAAGTPPNAAAAALTSAALWHAKSRDWQQAWELADWASTLGLDLPAHYAVEALMEAATREATAGSVGQAKNLARHAAELARADTSGAGRAQHLIGLLHLLDEEIPAAVTALSTALDLDPFNVDIRADLAEAVAADGDLRRGQRLLAETPPQHSAVLRARAALAFAGGSAAEAVALLAEAAAHPDVTESVAARVRILFLAARIQRRRRRRAAARALLEEADQLCKRSALTVWASRVQAELARLTPPPTGRTGLTPMQERVASLAVNGATNVEIARSLAIGVTTVEGTLTQIYRRFDIRSRVELTHKFR